MKRNIKLLTSKDVVRQAIDEYDSLGREIFLTKYGYKKSRKYYLHFNGREYDSKAILCAAYGVQHGAPLSASDFSGGAENGERAAAMYSLIETAKLNDINPEAYLRHVLTHIVDHPVNRVEEFLPWNVSQQID
jgi:hypothetical protein